MSLPFDTRPGLKDEIEKLDRVGIAADAAELARLDYRAALIRLEEARTTLDWVFEMAEKAFTKYQAALQPPEQP